MGSLPRLFSILTLLLAFAAAPSATVSPADGDNVSADTTVMTDTSQLDALASDLAAAPDVVDNLVHQTLERLGLEIERDVVAYLDREGVSVDGDLRKSVTHQVSRTLGQIDLEAGAYAKHARFVHDGTRPHWAPKAPIERWVRKKLGVTKRADVASATWFVRKKIARDGTDGTPFLDDVVAEYLPVIAPRVRAAVLAAV